MQCSREGDLVQDICASLVYITIILAYTAEEIIKITRQIKAWHSKGQTTWNSLFRLSDIRLKHSYPHHPQRGGRRLSSLLQFVVWCTPYSNLCTNTLFENSRKQQIQLIMYKTQPRIVKIILSTPTVRWAICTPRWLTEQWQVLTK
jgi:hypothetical protein